MHSIALPRDSRLHGPVVIVYHRLGPYHVARLAAASAVMPIVAVEVSGKSREYAWDKVTLDGLARFTLFPEVDHIDLPASLVRREMATVLRHVQPAAVAVPGWSDKGALSAMEWCVANAVPCVMMSESAEGDARRSRFAETIKRKIVSLCGAALVGGTRHLAYMNKLGMEREGIFVSCDVVDNDFFYAQSIKYRESTAMAEPGLPRSFFLASARFIKKKNIPFLIKAYGRYRRSTAGPPWSLVILGDGPSRPEIEAAIRTERLEDNVFLPGFRQISELPRFYASASAFVHPSTVEQWGLVVNEAMASGLPVLVSKTCGCAPDLVREGLNGFTFDPFDIKALTECMCLISSSMDRINMGRESLRIISRWPASLFGRGLEAACRYAFRRPPFMARITERLLLRIVAARC